MAVEKIKNADTRAVARKDGARKQDDLYGMTQQAPETLDVLLDYFPGGMCLYDANLRLVLHNDQFRELLDLPASLFEGEPPSMEDLFRLNAERGEYGSCEVEQMVAERLARARERIPHVYERTRPNGTILEVRGAPVDGGGFITTYLDVTEQRRRTRQLEALVENYPGGICLFNADLNVTLYNERLLTLLDYPESLFEDGEPALESLFRFNAQRGEFGEGDAEAYVAEKMALLSWRKPHEYERTRPDGTVLQVRCVPIDGGGSLMTYDDVTARHRDQEMIAYMAHHDTLTDLPNRTLLADRMKQAAAEARRERAFALHYMDLDRFKPINDTHGHAVGDLLLQEVALRLRRVVREVDTVARIGGDEFVVLQLGAHDEAAARVLAERLVRALGQPFEISGLELEIGVSIGVALSSEHGLDTDALMKIADKALYEAKEAGRGTVCVAG